MHSKTTTRIIRLEDEISFRLRLIDVYNSFAVFSKNADEKAYYKKVNEELCNETFKLAAEREKERKRLKVEINLFIQNQLS